MIQVTKINNEEFVLNSTLIEIIELIPETKITLTNGKYYLVKESKDEVIASIIEFERKKLLVNNITKG